MGQKAVTRNRIGNPAEHSSAWITTEGTCQSPSRPTSQLRSTGWVQKGTEEIGHQAGQGLRTQVFRQHSPHILPAKSVVLTAAANGCQERSNPSLSLHDGVAGQAHEGGEKDEPRSQCLRESRGIC